MPLLNAAGVQLGDTELFVSRTAPPLAAQFCVMRFNARAVRRAATQNVLVVPFPSASARPDQVRVGTLHEEYPELFDDLKRAFDCAVPSKDAAPSRSSSSEARVATQTAVRVCVDFRDLCRCRDKGFRLSKTLKPLLEHHYADGFSFILCFLELPLDKEAVVEVTFTCPVASDAGGAPLDDDALFVPTLSRRQKNDSGGEDVPTTTVYSVNTGRSAGLSTDEAARRHYRKMSAALHKDGEHDALLAASVQQQRPLRSELLPLRLVETVELRKLRLSGASRSEDLLLELDEATLLYFDALRAVRRNETAVAEKLLGRCLTRNAQHVAALALLASVLQADRRRTVDAERQFRLLLRANPVRADSLQNFALFVETRMGDHDTAEVLYTRALSLDPGNARVLANFAVFLKNVRRDYDYAETLYKRAVQAAPDNANTIGNFALFVHSVRRDVLRADQLFRLARALERRQTAAAVPPQASPERYWAKRYEEFLADLRAAGQLESLLRAQLPQLSLPRTPAMERVERAQRQRVEQEERRLAERADAERVARRRTQRLPRLVVRCLRALVLGWNDDCIAHRDVCPRQQCSDNRDEDNDDIDDNNNNNNNNNNNDAGTADTGDNAQSREFAAPPLPPPPPVSPPPTRACGCVSGGSAVERPVTHSVLFVRTLDALAEATFARAESAVMALDDEFDADDELDETFVAHAVGDASVVAGASSMRGCVVRALTLLRGRAAPLQRARFDALGALLAVAVHAAFDAAYYAQLKDLMHMAITYHLAPDEAAIAAGSNGSSNAGDGDDDDDDDASIESLTSSVESSADDGEMRGSADSVVVVAAQPVDASSARAVRQSSRRAALPTLVCGAPTLLAPLSVAARDVWRCAAFWEAAFVDELRAQQRQHEQQREAAAVPEQQSLADIAALDDDGRSCDSDATAREEAMVTGQLASFATNMILLQLDFDFIADFVDKQIAVHDVSAAARDELLRMLATHVLVEHMTTLAPTPNNKNAAL